MAAPTYDLNINQYATFNMSLQLTDSTGSAMPLTSWSFTGSIKTAVETDPPITKFDITIVDYSQSLVNVVLYPTQSALLIKPAYVYDIIATNATYNPSEVYRILQGKVKVNLGVTDLDADN